MPDFNYIICEYEGSLNVVLSDRNFLHKTRIGVPAIGENFLPHSCWLVMLMTSNRNSSIISQKINT